MPKTSTLGVEFHRKGVKLRHRRTRILLCWLPAAVVAVECVPSIATAATEAPGDAGIPQTRESAAADFDRADLAVAASRFDEAIAIYKRLAHSPDMDVRTDARFRHGKLQFDRNHFGDAALLLRAVLDEKPYWQLARVTLARTFARMGRQPSARRELRQAQADGLEPPLQPFVDNFYEDLRAVRPFGGTIELAFAPNSNINRPTGATIVNGAVAPFSLTSDPNGRSGNGLRVSSVIYGYVPLTGSTQATARLTLNDNLYRSGRYNDHIWTGEIGTVTQWHDQRLRASFGQTLRVYGDRLSSTTTTLALNWLTNLGATDQIEFEGDFGDVRYKANPIRSGRIYTASMIYEHAFTQRAGGRLALVAQRQTAGDPGYASAVGGATATAWQEFGRTTIQATLGVQRLEADARLPAFTARRSDWLVRSALSVTLRRFRILGFAPVIRATYDVNFSTVDRYDYKRLEGEFALNRAF